MTSKKPKSIDALMKYLRNSKGVSISGSSQKRKLRNIGYYHGYKGYRYINKPSNTIPYQNFNEIVAIYDFDSQLKSLFYPCVMQIETALKNYVLEEIIKATKSDSFIDTYNILLDNYKSFSITGKTFPNISVRKKAEDRYKNELKRRLDLRNRIYKVQTDAFGNGNKIAMHFTNQGLNLPIWSIFELLSLGEFGHFVSCLNQRCRMNISKSLGIQQSDDTNGMLTQRLIYTTRDLRNAIAHNDVIFDTRFKTSNIDKQVSNAIANATGVIGLSFDTITDYLILLIYQMKLIGLTKKEMKKIIAGFSNAVENLRNNIPINTFNQIIHTDYNTKIQLIKKFV